ncbi:hypothetical protein ES708_27895 [subsurface metagenome]
MAGNSRQGIPGIDQLESFAITLFTYQTDILWNILVNGAGRFTGRRIAVGQGESLIYRDTLSTPPGFLSVIEAQGLFSQGANHFHIYIAVRPGSQLFQQPCHLAKTEVTPRFEQIGCHGNRSYAAPENALHIEHGSPPGIGNWELSGKISRDLSGQIHG